MNVSDRFVRGITVVDISGRLHEGDRGALRQRMASLLDAGHRRLVINLANVDYLDSAALGELVACQLRATQRGAVMKLANAARRIQDLLLLTRLITVFEAHDSIDAAVESFDERKAR